MNIHFFRLEGTYVFSGNTDQCFDFEEVCNLVSAKEIRDILINCFPYLNKPYIKVKASWTYEGFQVFIIGTKLSEKEAEHFVEALDPLKQIGICHLFWDYRQNFNTTGILLAYDYNHYCKVVSDNPSFIVIAVNGMDKFINDLQDASNYIPPSLYQNICGVEFKEDKEYLKRITGEKLSGKDFSTLVHINNNVILED